MRPTLPSDYRPSEEEEFMGPLQIEYFRQKLLQWRAELLADSSDTLRHLKEESLLKPDLTDRASLETERAIELRTRDRERKLISKIDIARKPTSRSASAGWRRGRSRPSRSRRRSATSAWSARTATIDRRC
jgi:DnaK suppressor protein